MVAGRTQRSKWRGVICVLWTVVPFGDKAWLQTGLFLLRPCLVDRDIGAGFLFAGR
jgi:hypothetical protein